MSNGKETKPDLSIKQLETEINLARTEMIDTINALTDRLHPKALASHATESAKEAAQDTAALLTGTGFPADHRKARNVKILLVTTAVVVAGVGIAILNRKRN